MPGFYYDKKKKKYFKIPPNGFNLSSNQYTRDTVERKKLKREEKRRYCKTQKARLATRLTPLARLTKTQIG